MWGYQIAKAAKYCLTFRGWLLSLKTICEYYKILPEELYTKIKEYNGCINNEAYIMPTIRFYTEQDIKLFIEDYLTSLDIINQLRGT